MKPKVSIILLNYNNEHFTVDCLKSLEHVTYPNIEPIVVDNGSKPESIAAVRAAAGSGVERVADGTLDADKRHVGLGHRRHLSPAAAPPLIACHSRFGATSRRSTFASAGNQRIPSAQTSSVPSPPITTAGTTPNHAAVRPDSNSPS